MSESSQPVAARPPRVTCPVCGNEVAARELVPTGTLRSSLTEQIASRHPGVLEPGGGVCRKCLAQERFEYVKARLVSEKGELSAVEEDIARRVAAHQLVAADMEQRFESSATLGQRVADRVATVGGSWSFLIAFVVILAAWAVLNSLALGAHAFDPYPYILLNLFLSCLAAVQAPIIMMSQNRVAARDRMEADQDFRINLKAELEIASLHEKVDHLLHSQWQHLVELQEIQLEVLNELSAKKR